MLEINISIQSTGVSAATGEGFDDLLIKVDEAKEEYLRWGNDQNIYLNQFGQLMWISYVNCH